jgi:hypothetical protein
LKKTLKLTQSPTKKRRNSSRIPASFIMVDVNGMIADRTPGIKRMRIRRMRTIATGIVMGIAIAPIKKTEVPKATRIELGIIATAKTGTMAMTQTVKTSSISSMNKMKQKRIRRMRHEALKSLYRYRIRK